MAHVTGAAEGGMPPPEPSARDEFLALVSHELRTPLAVIRGWLDTILSVPELDPDIVRSGLVTMQDHVARMERLTADLLDSAAVQLGNLRLRLADVDLADIVRAVVESFPGPIDLSIGADRLPVRADADRVGQLLSSIVTVAKQRATDGVSVHAGADPDVAGQWRIDVRVPGVPLPADDMVSLFQPLEGGTGDSKSRLSLYVSRALAAAHGGRCGVVADDRSMRFWVRLPVEGPPA